MKKYSIKTNDIGMCMSVGCDFYQTCSHNSVNMFYKTQRKFEPVLDEGVCLSYDSGKNTTDYPDNCYPNLLKKIYEYQS
jgi:hypothetical protein